MNINKIVKNLKSEMETFISRGGMFCFEYRTAEDDHLLVDLEIVKKGIEFSFDSNNLPCHFSGEVVKIHSNRYLLKANSFTETLDEYLQTIHEEIMEGYLLPNELYFVEA